MARVFNVNGACRPSRDYMVDLKTRLKAIRTMVDDGAYFTINKARQYGKTTTLRALEEFLKKDYLVVSLDFQRMSFSDFSNEAAFVNGLAREISRAIRYKTGIPEEPREKLNELANVKYHDVRLAEIFECFTEWCEQSVKPIVLLIDEVDSATNNQVFLDFLAQLRAAYLDSDRTPTFQSVILAGVHDVRNIKRKIRVDEEHKVNSPWNIAADFDVDMSFSEKDITIMLEEYETDYHTGMDVEMMAGILHNYTSGYPFLVSRLCKLMDEQVAGSPDFPDKSSAWTKNGFLEAVKLLLNEKNTLFESLIGKLNDYPELNAMLRSLLFTGKTIAYNADEPAIDTATMFGFIKNQHGAAAIANRIFEMRLYNLYLSSAEMQGLDIYKASLLDKNQFIVNGHLNMRLILEKFVVHFNDLYGDSGEEFVEDEGRKYFLLYLRPIINGTGNYYIEAQTRSLGRTDVIVDYRGEQYVVELKIWRGNEYNMRGEEQLAGYLEDYHMDKGYMVSFNFNKKKQIGVYERIIGDKTLIEAVV